MKSLLKIVAVVFAACCFFGCPQLPTENYPPVLKIEKETVKITPPGKDYLEALKAEGCDGYIIGIASGKTAEGWDKWIFGKIVHLTDADAFADVDFTLDFVNGYSNFEDGKVCAILDFYKNVDLPEGEREWLKQIRSPEVTYTPDPELTPVKLEIVNETVKVTPPGKKYLEALKTAGCNGYCIGIRSGKYSDEYDNWMFGKSVLLTDENAFKDEDFTLDFVNNYSKFIDGKIFATIDFYKDVKAPENERGFIILIESPEVTYTLTPSLFAKTYNVDLSASIIDTWLSPNVWGDEGYSKYQNSGFDVTDLIQEQPKSGDTINFIWKGKSDSNIKNLFMMIADIEFFDDGHTKWSQIVADKDRFVLAASDVKAGEEMELISTFTLNADSANKVYVFLTCGENDVKETTHLYTNDYVAPNSDTTLKGKLIGTILYGAEVSDNVITWKKGEHDGGCGWELSGFDLSEYDRVRVEFESTDAPLMLSLCDINWKNSHSFWTRVEENVLEANLTGKGADWITEGGTDLDKSKGMKIYLVSYVGEDAIRETDQTTVVKKVQLLPKED